jgi:SnoaL-like polyketide cyclase
VIGYGPSRKKESSYGGHVWEDVVEQVPLPGQGPGLDGLKDILRAMRSGFPDIVFSIQEQVAEHDKVASRFEWTGTHNGEFLGIPATGRPVRGGSRYPGIEACSEFQDTGRLLVTNPSSMWGFGHHAPISTRMQSILFSVAANPNRRLRTALHHDGDCSEGTGC